MFQAITHTLLVGQTGALSSMDCIEDAGETRARSPAWGPLAHAGDYAAGLLWTDLCRWGAMSQLGRSRQEQLASLPGDAPLCPSSNGLRLIGILANGLSGPCVV
jgi:hypothetical protein